MSALSIFKSASEVVVSLGVGTIVGNVIKSTTPPPSLKGVKALRYVTRGSVVVGSWAISGFVGDLASKHVVSKIDDAVASFTEVKGAVNEAIGKIEDES